MAHPVVHAEIRSKDPDATRVFFSGLFGWTYSEGAFPGYTFVDTGVEGALPTAISPLQGASDAVLFFIGVDDVEATLEQAEAIGGRPARTSRGSRRYDIRTLTRTSRKSSTPARRAF